MKSYGRLVLVIELPPTVQLFRIQDDSYSLVSGLTRGIDGCSVNVGSLSPCSNIQSRAEVRFKRRGVLVTLLLLVATLPKELIIMRRTVVIQLCLLWSKTAYVRKDGLIVAIFSTSSTACLCGLDS